MIDKNSEVVGVSQALKKLSSISTVPSLSKQNQIDENDASLMDNKITINPSNEAQCSENEKIVNESEVARCGWWNFRPDVIQPFMKIQWCLVFLCLAGAVQGLVINGLINTVITSIERRFGLQSRQSGFIASGYDIASFFCLIPVSYFGGRAGVSKLKWVGIGIIVMGFGFFVFALPHFLVGQYRAEQPENNICISDSGYNETTRDCSDSMNAEEDISWTVWFFFVAQLLHGMGASPLYTLGVTYIDENVSRKMSSVYLGCFYTTAILGPAIGYLLGGQILLIYTDLNVDPTLSGLTPESKVWVGAWYLGFLFFSVVCLLIAIPLIAFPASMPGSDKLVKVSEAHDDGSGSEKCQVFTKMNEIPKALRSLVKNPSFLFLNLAGASEGLIISGFAVFLPKLLENQYSVTAVSAALLMGLICVPAGGGGTFLGGYLVKKLKLSCSGTMKFCMIASMFAVLFTICFFLSCPNLKYAGVTSTYQLNVEPSQSDGNFERYTAAASQNFNLDNQCNKQCGCTKENYEPICGSDGLMYYNPCFAGCQQEKSHDGSKVYLNCNCIINNLVLNTNLSKNPLESGVLGKYNAVNKMCDSKCEYLPVFIILCFFVMFFTFLATMPALSATLRCVDDKIRSFALGIQWIVVRVLGTIPAPILFGRLIDESCILWQQESCRTDSGSCLLYDNQNMAKYMLLLAVIGKLCSVIFFFFSWYYYIPPKVGVIHETENKTSEKYVKNDVEKY